MRMPITSTVWPYRGLDRSTQILPELKSEMHAAVKGEMAAQLMAARAEVPTFCQALVSLRSPSRAA